MVIDKILNNNTVIIIDQSGQEIIVMGKGIGFQKKVGSEIIKEMIDKIFTCDKDALEQFKKE